VHTRRWAEAFAARGHEVKLLTSHPPDGPLGIPWRVVGLPFPLSWLRYASARDAVRAERRAFRPDVIVAHFLPNYGFLAALAGVAPWALVCWGSDLLINATRTPLHRARASFTLRRAGLIHVDAAVLAEAAERLGAPRDRIWTRAWGVDTDALAPSSRWEERRARSGPLRILWTRLLEPLYGPEVLIRALGLLARRGVPFRATIAGSGSLRRGLEAAARREGIDGSTRFAGWVDTAALGALYREHDAYVSLSRSDSTSQSLLEAMAAGLLPVVSDIAGNREWVTHRTNGLLVTPHDAEAVACALAELAQGGARAGEMAAHAQAAVAPRGRFAETVAQTEARLLTLAG